MKQSEDVRQNAFQENDIVSMVSKVTKYSITVMDAHELRYHLEKAIALAQQGRPGPVLLDLPHNIQKAELDFDNEKSYNECDDVKMVISENVIDDIIKSFSDARRPLIIVGGGAENTRVKTKIKELLSIWNVPVVATLRGLDVVSNCKENHLGFAGAYGNRAANYAIKHSDVIIVLGARLDERFICTNDKTLFSGKKVYHVDIDPVELGRVVPAEIKIERDLNDFFDQLFDRNLPKLNFENWNKTVVAWKKRYSSLGEDWSINRAVRIISNEADENAVFTLDIGINQMCAAQAIVLKESQKCYTSAGHGAMGCSVPLAIGAVYADKNKIANCFVGDGALHMNIQELLMIGKNRLPIHVILIIVLE